jgi:hypothetical protein
MAMASTAPTRPDCLLTDSSHAPAIQVRSSDEAREWFRRGRGADLLITDKYRENEPPPEPWNAGKKLVAELRGDGNDMPVIFYTLLA